VIGQVDAAVAAPPAAPPVERDLVLDIAKHGLMIAPAIVIIAGLARGGAGAASAAFAVAIVIFNLALSGAALSWAARTSLNLLMAVALGGFLLRMGLVTGVIVLVRHQSWVDLPVLAFTLLLTQLGLLFCETKYVSATLAFPGLKPAPATSPTAPAGKEQP
jgi:hypothetical protein